MGQRVTIEPDCCIGCGNCEATCPEVFRLNPETDRSEVIKPEGGPKEQIQDAIDNCPGECIHWED